ncbi:unnamed protein product [Phaeothamnion confervicola]
MGYNLAGGLSSMLKDGHQSFEGVDEAIMRNIEAAKQLADVVKTSLGPNGMNKLVVTHLDKTIVTSDGATVVNELEVQHPAAKMLVLASQMQEKECGDGTSFVVTFAGELLRLAGELLRQGLHTAEILEGYKRAAAKCAEALPGLVCHTVADVRDKQALTVAIRDVLASKQYGFEDTLAPFVAEATLAVMPPAPAAPSVSVESVRVVKLLGGSVAQSHVVRGMVVQRSAEGSVKRCADAKVTVFGCGIEASSTEAKGTVLIHSAEELMNYNKASSDIGEEKLMEEIIKSVADSGATVVVSGGSVSDMAMHFLERHNIMVIKVPSKWELRRVCQATNATALVRLGPATPEEMGSCKLVEVREVGSRKVTVFEQPPTEGGGEGTDARVATVVLRASTDSLLNDIERAVDDGVHCARGLCRDPRFVPGAGATEIELARQVLAFADEQQGLDQYAIRKFAEALEVVPRILADTAGLNASAVLARLRAAHAAGRADAGVDIEAGGNGGGAVEEEGMGTGGDNGGATGTGRTVWDLLSTKESALRLAVDAALTVLRVDQIIMSKPAGGPKPRAPQNDTED